MFLSTTHRKILSFAWPMTVAMLSYTAMSVVDTLFVGQLGTAPVAAIGIAYVVSHVPLAIGFGLTSGARIAISHAVGADDLDAARRVGWQGVWIGLCVGLVTMLVAGTGPVLFSLLGSSAEVAAEASDYFEVRLLTAPVLFLRAGLIAWFHANNDTRTPMVTGVLANTLNVALDPILIFGWGPLAPLGVLGAALATAISVGIEAFVLGLRAGPALAPSSAAPDGELARRIIRLGLPVGGERLLDVLSWTVFVSVLSVVGDAHLAAHVIAIRIVSVSFLPGLSIGEAAGVLAGQAVGAGDRLAARKAWRGALELATALMAAFGVVFLAVPDLLIGGFGATAEVSAIARQVLAVAAAFQVFDAVATVSLCALIGAGDTRFVALITVGAAWVVKIPLVGLLVGVLGLGAPGAWSALLVELLVLGVVAVARVQGGAWLAAEGSGEPALA